MDRPTGTTHEQVADTGHTLMLPTAVAVATGKEFRVGRDNVSWPLEGGGDYGTTTLRNIGYGRERSDHTRWGDRGQTSTEIIVLSKPVRSWTYVPIGQSDRPSSPHYRDQAEKARQALVVEGNERTPVFRNVLNRQPARHLHHAVRSIISVVERHIELL